ncbi:MULTISPECIES: DUF3566 domain-containing protein [unclassified Corynebacterium]|uniref:DUF3566 domain-containing protein n=1 Tax=unclassified Corynebacterium TaxID=2624378 RepID=UPI0030A84F1B
MSDATDTHLTIRQISPWAVMRISAAVGVVGFLAWMIAVGLIYVVLEGMGFWNRFAELVGGDGGVSAGLVFGLGAAIGALWMVLVTALATLGAIVYNACSDFVGGIKIAVRDTD